MGETGEGIWERNACATAIALTGEAGELPERKLPDEAKIISEDVSVHADLEIPVRRQWIRISTCDALMYYASFPYTLFIAAGDVDANLFSAFLEESKVNGPDPLLFGLAALHSASWIYVPQTDRLGDEIYINRNPQETARLLADERVADAPHFTLRCFC